MRPPTGQGLITPGPLPQKRWQPLTPPIGEQKENFYFFSRPSTTVQSTLAKKASM